MQVSAKKWVLNLWPRRPDMNIGGEVRPYIRRWYLLSTPWFRIYLHNMLRNDDDRALHDHPWANASFILKGGFREVMPKWDAHDLDFVAHIPVISADRLPGSLTFRKATDAHRLELLPGVSSSWSLFFTGRYQRKWGFHCPKGWIPYERFVKQNAPGEIGAGCDG